jgi:hypothetical protein
MAVGEVNLTSGNNLESEDDDESNINSDEQNEYLEINQNQH